MKLEISLAPEALFHIGSFPVTNSFLMMLAVTLFLSIFVITLSKRLKMSPTGSQNVFEMMIEGGQSFIKSIIDDDKKVKKVFPLVFSLFVFILIANLANFIPGQMALTLKEGDRFVPVFRGVMADYSMVLVLTLITIITVQITGFIMCGPFGYLGKFFNFKNPLKLFVGLLEFIGELAKILSLSFRLFGNIFAGEVLMSVMLFLAPFIIPLPFMALELMTAVVQAFVFSVLTLVFTKMAGEMEEGH
jgi:F-type H+-transporting ATPase subunit a